MVKLFLSHISEEAQLAEAIKQQLELALPGAEVFVSAVDIHLGEAWLKAIDEAVDNARAVLVLCSRRSTGRPWVNFESGAGWAHKVPVIPVCHSGLRRGELPYPLSIFQGLDLDSAKACEELADRISGILGITVAHDFDFAQMASRLEIKPPQRTSEIGIDFAHGQAEWDSEHNSVFDLPRTLPQSWMGHWSFHPLHQVDELLSADLHRLSGIILGNPWRKRMQPEVVSALGDWVMAGGRLLLLGYELGDRHHGGNLEDLARHFGIQPVTDLVGPPDYGPSKPYGIPVDFQVADGDPHPFTQDLFTIRLTNVQTIHVEPGGTEWLRVGKNVVYRPTRSSVEYRRGTLTQPRGQEFLQNVHAGWVPVAVQAPPGLCGDGAVHAVGTWDLFEGPEASQSQDNLKLLRRILDWLSRHPFQPMDA